MVAYNSTESQCFSSVLKLIFKHVRIYFLKWPLVKFETLWLNANASDEASPINFAQ